MKHGSGGLSAGCFLSRTTPDSLYCPCIVLYVFTNHLEDRAARRQGESLLAGANGVPMLPGTTFFFLLFFNLTYSRWTSSLPFCLWSLRIFPSLPGSRLTTFLLRCKFSTLTTRQPMVEFYLLTFPRFPLRKKEHKSYFGKNRTHGFRTSRCAVYLLGHSGDE